MSRFPFPHDPSGWFCLGRADQLTPGQLRAQQLFGSEVVLFRARSGKVGLLEAWCPHLGAHFAHGGEVCGEHLRCPFHSFRFDTEGRCVATPYGHAPPRAARARSWPLVERDGLLFAWHHPEGAAPTFQLPAHDPRGWTRLQVHAFDVASHPQEISENSVDTGHFAAVHGYDSLEVVRPLQVDGPVLRTTYAFHRHAWDLGVRGELRFEIAIAVHGLGYSVVDVRADRLPLHTRQYVLPTPTAPGKVRLRIAIHMERPARWRQLSPPLVLVPPRLAEALVGRLTMAVYAHDVAKDLDVWTHKIYVHPPRLARGDGPVGQYRQWCRQFYPHTAAAN